MNVTLIFRTTSGRPSTSWYSSRRAAKLDALHRRESCGGHFRAESQTPEGEALRHDDEFLYVGAWEWGGEGRPPILHKEDLIYKDIELKQRSYK